jgi:hypothetical protein
MNIYYQFRDRAKTTPERIYIMFEGEEYTYRDIEKGSGKKRRGGELLWLIHTLSFISF